MAKFGQMRLFVVSKSRLAFLFGNGTTPVTAAMLRRSFLNEKCWEACFKAEMSFETFKRRKNFYIDEVEKICSYFKIDYSELYEG
jgi:hypothetical protein